MKLRLVRRAHTVIALIAGLFGVALVLVSAVWPAAFAIVIAIGGAFGALMVFYEISLTKRIAQAEFVRDLQSGFASDANIGEVWRKLLLKEPITPADRARVSSYLTFFETLHLLLIKGTVELGLIDDLFRNRFFTAIGDRGILETALIREAGAFANIHDLIETWHAYLVSRGIPVHPGYYAYIQALVEAKGYEVVRLGPHDHGDLLGLQERVVDTLADPAWLRRNDDVMLKECLLDHVVLGARTPDGLVAAAVLYDGGRGKESIRRYFTEEPAALDRSINLKLVLAAPEARRAGVGRTLVELLEQRAAELGKGEIVCTVHPRNLPSRALFARLGYSRIGPVATAYGPREAFVRTLPTLTKRWAR